MKAMKQMSCYGLLVRRNILRATCVLLIFLGIFKLLNYETMDLQNYNGRRCPIPPLRKEIQAESWYALYLSHLQNVSLETSSHIRRPKNCARWWHSTPQLIYEELPDRSVGWKPIKMPPNYKRPKCNFGQELVPRTKCGSKHEMLWTTLDEMNLVYFPRSGTELGIVRGSSYLSSDGDIDIFVDMPQKKLLEALLKTSLSPPPYMSGDEVHWTIHGCPEVHLVFFDWMTDEMVKRPTHMDTCTCMINSVTLTCHKEGLKRMFTMYGPSWRVPLHTKNLDMPWIAHKYNTAMKLTCMASHNGIIKEKSVRELDRAISYSAQDMNLILAQLNVLKAMIDVKTPVRSVLRRYLCQLGF